MQHLGAVTTDSFESESVEDITITGVLPVNSRLRISFVNAAISVCFHFSMWVGIFLNGGQQWNIGGLSIYMWTWRFS